MAHYTFTKKGYQILLKKIDEAEKELKKAIELKATSGVSQDGWHDEGFKLAQTEEFLWQKRTGELKQLASNAEVVEPIEQNTTVELGAGVILEYENGNTSKFILEGFAVEALEGRLSIHSPLGQAILGARKGEKRNFQVGKNKRSITIKKILLPSVAETLFQEETKNTPKEKNSQSKT